MHTELKRVIFALATLLVLVSCAGVPKEEKPPALPPPLPTARVKTESAQEMPQPQSGMPQPQSGIPQPQAGMPQSQVKTPQQQSGIPQPQAGMPQPRSGMPQPQAGMPQSRSGMPQPQAGMPQSQVKTPQQQSEIAQQQALILRQQAEVLQQQSEILRQQSVILQQQAAILGQQPVSPQSPPQFPVAGGIILEGAKTHSVTRTDTLSNIAKRYYGPKNGYYYGLIMLASKITDPDTIKAGTRLVIPDLERNLADPGARERLKAHSAALAAILAARGNSRDAGNMRATADAL